MKKEDIIGFQVNSIQSFFPWNRMEITNTIKNILEKQFTAPEKLINKIGYVEYKRSLLFTSNIHVLDITQDKTAHWYC